MNLVIISGPSGAGKSSIVERAKSKIPNLYFSISSTTRAIRDGEQNGVHYNFISKDEFLSGIEKGDFLEWAQVHNNYYGTPKAQILNALNENKIVLFDIDVQGQKNIKAHFGDSISIFITTKTKEILKSRLYSRKLDSIEVIENRLKMADIEIESIDLFDFVIINDNLERASDGFISIIKSLAHKNSRQISKNICNNWQKK